MTGLALKCGAGTREPIGLRKCRAGAEEEGVWMRATPVATGEAAALARRFEASALGVGVGECSGQAMIWVEALHRFNPLLHIEIKTREQARRLGADAARYIKGIPLRNSVEGR